METLTHKDLLRDPLWLQTRLRILERDNFRCTLCGDDRTELRIYHKKHIEGLLPWEYPDEVLTTLCSCCSAFAKINQKIHGFSLDDIKAVHVNIPKSPITARAYRMDETVLLYLFNQDHKIVTSYNMSGAVNELREFLK